MGATTSTILGWVGIFASSVLSALSATAARKKDYPVAKKWGWIAVSVSSVLVCTNLFIIIKSRASAAVVTSALEEVAFGVMISSVLLLTGLCGMAVLQSISLNGLYVNDATKSEDYSIYSAILGFGVWIVSLIVTIFLL